MGTLTEFLNEQAKNYDEESRERRRRREEWVKAVDSLLSDLEKWLKKADRHGILEINRQTYEKNEEKLGPYEVEGLVIRLAAREVKVLPVAGSVVRPSHVLPDAPHGRIDLTNGSERYTLYRLVDPHERWFMTRGVSRPPVTIDEDSFGDAVQDLLK
jgi:hypothetical protein